MFQRLLKNFYFVATIQILSGAFLTIFLKLQDKQRINGIFFQHYYIQSIISFIGQTINYAIYYYQCKYQKEKIENDKKEALEKGKKINVPIIILIIPAFFNFLCMVSGLAAYFYINASITMMLKSGLPVVTSILSYIFFKRISKKHENYGMGIIIIGSIVIGLFAVGDEDAQSNSMDVALGVFFALVSLLTYGLIMISEEYLLKNYSVQSTIIAATEGLASLIISIILIPIISYINPNFIDFSLFFYQHVQKPTLIISSFGILISVMIFTLFNILLIKFSSALMRSVIYQLRIILIWLLFMLLPNPSYFQTKHWEEFSIIQFFGYLFLLYGVFTFNNQIKIPFINLIKKEINGKDLNLDQILIPKQEQQENLTKNIEIELNGINKQIKT